MATKINFKDYENMYKRIVNVIEIDRLSEIEGSSGYENETSVKEPLIYDDKSFFGDNGLFINLGYFNKNKRKILGLVVDTISSTYKKAFTINSDELINDEVISAIANSSYIKSIKLNSKTGINRENIEVLISGGLKYINCSVDFEQSPELLYMGYKNVEFNNYPSICNNSLSNFINDNVYLKIEEKLEEEELERLKILCQNHNLSSVRIEFDYKKQLQDVLSCVEAENIVIVDQEEFTLEDYQYLVGTNKNIYLEIPAVFEEPAYVRPGDILEKNRILNDIVEEVKALDFSPLEQYMYLYNITKMFKEFKEVEKHENSRLSRETVFTLFNEYMVCVAYADLLKELVDKLDNPDLSVACYSCSLYDRSVVEGHRRCLVKIKDDKYGVDGIYISDPTWDSINYYHRKKDEDGEIVVDYNIPTANNDYYNHLLLTKEEMVDEDIEYAVGDVTDVLFGVAPGKDPSKVYGYVNIEAAEALGQLFHKSDISDVELATSLEHFAQPPVSSETIFEAVKNLYSKLYICNEEQLDTMVQNTIEINNIYQQKHFSNTKDKFNSSAHKK